ncbi:LysR family transcriptional regulator [Comamonas serinivorans]|uniref:LysR family transcriptional regulator n=1 Tax=Comamonas serinivorans TaxID=1082851 RepID=A0A1Y0EPM6_9BURK|nr:LysR family transcriptional regulator [Comamonas serinivorans]ARU05583.1 LysR family transcriptional regulator [Comamonas serinivorans]
MELRHLRYFLVLAEELHYGRAAERLAMSQPPLSVAIRQLEDAVGTRLLERNSKSVRLTAAGKALAVSARQVLEQAEEAKRLAHAVGEGKAGRLRVGFVGGMLFRGLAQALQQLAHTHPLLEVHLTEMNTHDQLLALAQGRLELAFVHSAPPQPGLQVQLLASEQFVACLPQGHRLAGQPRIELAQLADEAFVLFSATASPDYHVQILHLCAQAGLNPAIRHEVRHWLSVVSMVAQGMGVALVPQSLSQAGLPGVAYLPLRHRVSPSQTFAAWRTESDPAVAALLGHLTSRPGDEVRSPAPPEA